ncbi:hypothetical protein OEZ86_009031 [Tetradesmus obliquus]|nr:hypothetical protein OEZ86_009031 [Tetradesmus obliquus]
MPRVRQIAGSGKVQRRVEEAVLDDSSEQLQQSIEEADGLLGPEGPGLVQQSSHWLRTMSRALPWEADSKEAGPFLESWWRLHLRLPRGGGGALLAYERAMRLRGYVERASRPNLLAHEPSLDAVLTGSVQAQDISDLLGEAKPSVMLEAWGEVPQPERAKLLLQYTHVVTNVRQHGFASVGKLSPHSPLGQLLLHGLQLMLGMAFDGSIRQQLESRLGSAARLYFPNMEKGRLQALYQHNNKAGLLGGQIALAGLTVPLPPASSQLPMFDQLSLSCQLSFASDVLQRLLCKDQPLPDDHALSFAAFQKLLLLGLLAPLEEATAAASGRKGGQHVALAAARADRQRIAAARQVRYFLSYDQLNLRFREAGVVASAVRATWKQPGWNPPENEAAIGLLSRQAARCANKMQALAAVQHSIMPVWPDSNPIAAGSLAALLQLACLSGSAPCLLAYCDLKPAAKAAAAAATAAAHSKGSSSGSSTRAPAANVVYPDPDMPDATAGLSSSSSSSSKDVCPIASELMHEHLNLQHRFKPADCTLLSKVPGDRRNDMLLGCWLEGFGDPAEEVIKPRFRQDLDCWRALSETCDGCGVRGSSSRPLQLCVRCECAVLCWKCIASEGHPTEACSELLNLQDDLREAQQYKQLEMCRCNDCISRRLVQLRAFEMRPRFSPLQQLLVPWQHWLQQQQQQQQQQRKPSPGWLGERQQRDAAQQQQQGRLLLPVTVLSADQAREVRRNPVAVCREAEQMRLRQYSAAWSTHLAMLDASMVEVMAEYGEVRQKEEETLQKEGQLQKDSSSSKAASGGAAFAASMIGAGLKAGAAGMWGAFGAGMWGGMGRQQQQQQQQQGAGARFGAKPFQGVGMSDSSLFGHSLDGLD